MNVCEGFYGGGFSGDTWLYLDGNGHIYKAALLLNNSVGLNSSEKRNVYCHEVGHSLGLEHWNSSNSCMDNTDFADLRPVQHDYDALNALYGHGDGYNSSHSAGGSGGGGCRPSDLNTLLANQAVTVVWHRDLLSGESINRRFAEPFFAASDLSSAYGPIC